MQEVEPIDRDLVYSAMHDRWAATQAYLDTLWVGSDHFPDQPVNCLDDRRPTGTARHLRRGQAVREAALSRAIDRRSAAASIAFVPIVGAAELSLLIPRKWEHSTQR